MRHGTTGARAAERPGASRQAPRRLRLRARRLALLLAVGLVVGVGPSAAQDAARDGGARTHLGAALQAGLLIGDASDFLDSGPGVEVVLLRELDRSRILGLRASAGYLDLADDEGGAAGASADNALLALLAGPTVQPALGPVRLFLQGLVGAVANLPDFGGDVADPGTSWSGAYGGEAGLRLPLGPRPVTVEAGMRIMDTGRLEFARSGPDGHVTERDVALLGLRLGLTVGL